jgi:HSP20 family protein
MAGGLKRYDPMSEMTRFDPFRNMEDMFKEFSMMPSFRGFEPERIRMDVSETDQAYLVKADMPGVSKDDIKIEIDGNRISISAEVKEEKEEKDNGKVVRSERYYGQQYRSFTLPQDVDDEKAEAKYQDGVLRLSLPKKPGSGGKKLAVH